MGKKKSVVLMVLLTIVIVVLCAIFMFPPIPVGGVNSWNPVTLQYDMSMELAGGRYAYYYPQGVKTEVEYNETVAGYDAVIANPKDAADKAKAEEDKAEYMKNWDKAGTTGSLYFSTKESDKVLEKDGANYVITEEFQTAFDKVAKEIAWRFEQKGYSDYKVAVVDGYAIRVEVPKSASDGTGALSLFSATDKMTITKGDAVLDELAEDGAKLSDFVSSVSVGVIYKQAYLSIRFNAAGNEMIEKAKSGLSSASDSSDSATTLSVKVGDQEVTKIYSDNIRHDNEVRILYADEKNKSVVETYAILFNSLIVNDGFDITFENVSDVREFGPVYGEHVVTLLYIALGIVLLAMLVLPVVKMGRFGIVSDYANLSFLVVVGICFKYLTGGIFEFSLGSVLVFVAGLALMNVLQYHIYKAIKKEFDLGKTVDSSVKGGYKKTLWNIVDMYAVLLLGAIALLFGGAGVATMGLQAIVCVVTGAFCNLLWARAINYIFLSASNNKYKYFRFVREDDDDE